jgi:RimJ/RimL family protein N-acetyltransferase
VRRTAIDAGDGHDVDVTGCEPSLPIAVPTLRGRSVLLRPFRETDADVVREASSDPLIPLITTVPTMPTPDGLLAYIHRQHSRLHDGAGYSFAIATAETDRAVGQIGLWLRDLRYGRVNVGYWVAASSRRRGYAAEALACVSDWGLTLPNVVRTELYVEPWNEGSWRAAEAAGFRREGLLRRWQRVGAEARDMFMYSRLHDDA